MLCLVFILDGWKFVEYWKFNAYKMQPYAIQALNYTLASLYFGPGDTIHLKINGFSIGVFLNI